MVYHVFRKIFIPKCQGYKQPGIRAEDFETLLKSINIYDEYSFSANSHTKVDLPTRLAPSTRIAVFPFLWVFHCSNLSYNFRLNILFIFTIFIIMLIYNILQYNQRLQSVYKYPLLRKCFYKKPPKIRNCFKRKPPKIRNCLQKKKPYKDLLYIEVPVRLSIYSH